MKIGIGKYYKDKGNLGKNNYIIFGLIAIAIIIMILTIGSIYKFEAGKNLKKYDFILDYTETEDMARQSTKDINQWLEFFRKKMKINKIGLQEENLITLKENPKIPVDANIIAKISKDIDWMEKYPNEFIAEIEKKDYDKYDVLVTAKGQKVNSFLKNAFNKRIENEKYYFYEKDGKSYIWIDGDSENVLFNEKYKLFNSKKKGFIEQKDEVSSKIMYISLGFLPEKIDIVKKAGFQIIPRTRVYQGFNGEKYINGAIEEYEKYNIHPKYLISSGEGVLGYDDINNKVLEKFVRKNKSIVGLIENNTQRENIEQNGVLNLAKITAESSENMYNAVRIFTMWDFIQNRYKYYNYSGAEEITNTLFRAITERNIRVIYFRPIKYTKDWDTFVTSEADYEELFSSLEKRLKKHGFSRGEAKPFNYKLGNNKIFEIASGVFVIINMMLGAYIAFINLLKLKDIRIRKVVNYLLGISIIFGCFYEVATSLKNIDISIIRHLIGFCVAVIFAVLSVIYYMKKSSELSMKINSDENDILKIILESIKILIISVLISMVGGLTIRANFSLEEYFLEISIFRGVKLAQILPLAIFPIIYLAYFGFGNRKSENNELQFEEIKKLLNINIKSWMMIVGALGASVGAYYILRTGHESSIEVSQTEMILRNFLEENLIARPRNKEFLFAFPAIMMAAYTSIKKMPLWCAIFGLAGVIGMTSVNNTFMHIRTPLYLGIARTGYSLLFSIIIGIIGMIIFDLFFKYYKKILINTKI